MLEYLPHLTVKVATLQYHVDDRRNEWNAVADGNGLLRILGEMEESDQQHIGCGSNARGELENRRHAECLAASLRYFQT